MENKEKEYTRFNLEYLDKTGEDFVLLEKYRKIEEELGCPIEVLFKAIKDGIYVYDINSNCRKVIKEEPTFILNKDIINEKKGFGFVITGRYIYLKDYGKTWWIKEDEEK